MKHVGYNAVISDAKMVDQQRATDPNAGPSARGYDAERIETCEFFG
jgi:hypothetical protein